MAALARRTWATMRTEVQKRIGEETNTAAQSRVEYWIDSAYRQIALGWHHYELDASSTITLASGNSSVALPADTYAILAVRLLDSAGSDLGPLTPLENLLNRDRRSGRPRQYHRHADTLHVDTIADAEYDILVFYYKDPPAPDFAAGSPELDRALDHAIEEGAVALGLRGYWQPDLAGASRQSLGEHLAALGKPIVSTGATRDDAERGGRQKPAAGVGG